MILGSRPSRESESKVIFSRRLPQLATTWVRTPANERFRKFSKCRAWYLVCSKVSFVIIVGYQNDTPLTNHVHLLKHDRKRSKIIFIRMNKHSKTACKPCFENLNSFIKKAAGLARHCLTNWQMETPTDVLAYLGGSDNSLYSHLTQVCITIKIYCRGLHRHGL